MMDPDRVRNAFADRYATERELGSGGMAIVFLARDLKHGRQVAVKVLRPEVAAAVGSDRFLREIRITAQLNHPHILPLLDSGEADGFIYYVMPYVAGGSLRRRMAGQSRLPLDAVLRVARHVAAALDHAHRVGVVHRDVKPENILFSEGLAVVADFGIAKAVSTAGLEALTRTGVPLGTPGYMSPEQAMGVAELDKRTDVYSLACVVYEMLTGGTPVVLPSPDDARLGRFLDAPPEHRELLDRLPGRVEQTLVKALAARPADRFESPGELAGALATAAAGTAKLSEAQVDEVLSRAAELQAEHPTGERALSIGAVEQVAAEVGIPPEHVREAVRELGRPGGRVVPHAATPGPTRVDYRKDTLILDRTLEGEIDESVHKAMVNEIQATLGIVGHVSVLGSTLTWSPAAPGTDERKVVVTVTPEAGKTQVHIEERFELSGWRIFVPGWGVGVGILTGLGLVSALGMGDRAMLLALLLAPVGAITAVALFFKGKAARHRPKLLELADRLAALAQVSAPRPALKSGDPSADA
ncbi:MAG: serine/threonine protein kinase [Gemmatimonadota bacterium]|nr:MAG: serine/threonine protein kinase [Gemmatimonadota bacterium]